ncbi:MAG: YaaR family protein [Firmicutes bacterium]|nr:YaaR family protein [Bacillota bacterium]
MKVERRRTSRARPNVSGPGGVARRGGSRGIEFREELRLRDAQHQAAIETMLAEVDQAAAQLKASGSLEALRAYKEALSRAVAAAVGRMYRVETETGFARGGRRRLLYIVRVLDLRLEELTRLLMAREKDNLAIVARLDEIRGLLLDLYR